MPLAFQTIPIPFAQGLDTKSDPKQVAPGRLLELENGVFTQTGAIAKRNGYDVSSLAIEGGTTLLTRASALASFKEELLLFSDRRLYSYVAATDAWRDRGPAVSLVAKTTPIVRNGYQQSAGDVAQARGIQVMAWQDSRGGLRYSVRDADTGAFYVQDAALSATGFRPKVLWFEAATAFVILFGTTGNLQYRIVRPGTPTTIGAALGLVGTFDAVYDAIVVADRLFVAWNRLTAGVHILYVTGLDAAGVLVTGASSNFNPGTFQASAALTLFADASRNVWAAAADATTVRAAWTSYSLGGAISFVTLETPAGGPPVRVAGVVPAATATILYEIEAAVAADTFIRQATLTLGGIAGAASDFARSVGLGSKMFVEGTTPYVIATHDSALQSTYLVLDTAGSIVARLSANVGGGLLPNATLPEVVATGTSKWLFATQQRGRLQVQSGTLFTRAGLAVTSLDFGHASAYGVAGVGENLLVVGGVLQSYDGVALAEHGFHLFPEGVSATASATGGSMTTGPGVGNYQYQVVYEWTDGFGQIHRSAPSVALTVAVTGLVAGSTGSVTLTLPTLRLSAKANVRIAIYRTQAAASIFYRVTSLTSPLFNNAAVDSVAFTDTLADSALPGNELLYTTGGVLDHVAPAACALATVFKTRVVLAGLQDDLQIAYSKRAVVGEALAFNDALTLVCDARGGAITALGALDDKLIVFKASAVFAMAGEGPSNTGQGDFAPPTLITTDAGCTNPQSIVATSAGLLFQSGKGIYLLDRSLAVSYIGAPVEAHNALVIKAATLVPGTNQVRFVTESGRSLVYDYQAGQWGTFTNQPAVGATVWRNSVYCYVRADGRVYRENLTKWTDGTEPIKLRLVTGWQSFAGLSGFQRVRSLHVLGEYRGAHTLRVGVAHDYSPAFTQEVNIDAGAIVGSATYGSDSPYGAGSPYGGLFVPYQFEVRLVAQKCGAVRFSIEDAQASGFNEGFRISALTLTVGVKRGARQLPASRNF